MNRIHSTVTLGLLLCLTASSACSSSSTSPLNDSGQNQDSNSQDSASDSNTIVTPPYGAFSGTMNGTSFSYTGCTFDGSNQNQVTVNKENNSVTITCTINPGSTQSSFTIELQNFSKLSNTFQYQFNPNIDAGGSQVPGLAQFFVQIPNQSGYFNIYYNNLLNFSLAGQYNPTTRRLDIEATGAWRDSMGSMQAGGNANVKVAVIVPQ